MAAPLVTQTDLERYFSPKVVRQAFTDTNATDPGPRLGEALQAGSDEARQILCKVPVWDDEVAVQKLVDGDASVRINVCRLVMAIGADAKPEWQSKDGPGHSWRSTALKMLDDLVQRRLKSPAEKDAGTNTVHLPRTVNSKQFEFSRRRDKPSSGGF